MSPDRSIARRAITAPRRTRTAAMATPTPVDDASRTRRADRAGSTIAVNGLLWLMLLAYAAFFIYLSWWRYHTFLPHAEDLGNMEQAAWNTAHGHPFVFNNQRIHSGLEATGTITRLSIHVEPIFLLLAIPYLIYAHPIDLIVIQTLVVVSGVFPAAWLARRYLTLPLAWIAFPLAYLLAPPLEAANLYEFHPVTLAAALLLWAFYFADGRRYWLFALFGILAAGTKEEIGVVVALIGFWIWWRHRDSTVGLTTAILSAGWTIFCFAVIIRHFNHGHSSSFCGRLNPLLMNGMNTGTDVQKTTCTAVAKLWLQHPDQVWATLVATQKLGFLHRMLVTTGYLSLLSPLTLAISIPSYALIMFSNDVHMYSGLAQYPAELVPVLIVAAIVGTAWLANRVGPVLRIPPAAVATVASVWLLVASVANAHVNGFTPLYEGFTLPQDTYHDVVGRRILAEIPKDAAVSAGDYLNPHLSDRRDIYLFPDYHDAQYVVVDVSREKFPSAPANERDYVQSMLKYGEWGVVDAADGYILMERRVRNRLHPKMGFNPALSTTLPPSFYSFVVPLTTPNIAHPARVDFGPSLQLLGYDVQRRDEVNLRLPDVVATTYWRLTAPVTEPISPVLYLTNGAGAIDVPAPDFPATDWLPMTRWPVGKIIVMQSVPLTVFTNDNGKVDIDLAVYRPDACSHNKTGPCDLLTDTTPTRRYLPNVRSTPGHAPMEVVDRGTILKLAQVPAHW